MASGNNSSIPCSSEDTVASGHANAPVAPTVVSASSEDKESQSISSDKDSNLTKMASGNTAFSPAPVPVGASSSRHHNAANPGVEGGSTVARKKCINDNVSWGSFMHIGLRPTMEDFIAIVPDFMSIPCDQFGGCTAPNCRHAHNGSQASNYCASRLHEITVNEWERGCDAAWSSRWEIAFTRAYESADDAFKDKALPQSVGSTALVVVVSARQIIAASCGDSRAVLCRGDQTIPLTVDHKPNREDESSRIIKGGGCIIGWDCARVNGILAMTRAIGDQNMKPLITSVPEVTFRTRREEDECLILASDGLWDVMSNEAVGDLACKMLRMERQYTMIEEHLPLPAQSVAQPLLKEAQRKSSYDNISVIVVDLKPLRRHQK